MNIIEKFNKRVDTAHSLVCVGLDSELSRIPDKYQQAENPQLAFNVDVIEATHDYASVYKLNSAFYEVQGEKGWQAMRETVAYLKANYPDIVTICDAKRADIGNTSDAYARSIYDELGFDAVTLHPYLGSDALEPFLSRADKGCIILCRTTNPGAGEFQELVIDGRPFYQHVAATVCGKWNANHNCMLVVGATAPDVMQGLRQIVGNMPFLVPGVGAQGGDLEATVVNGISSDGKGLMISASRSIIFADDPGTVARELRDAINQYR
ncbi:MAG: orotidine-5'-phosphate decarboxylase [Anaerolineae bacterium]|nr:orotidine-5'-phosphate decarboxylase [Anaerolineae bacterium]